MSKNIPKFQNNKIITTHPGQQTLLQAAAIKADTTTKDKPKS